MPLFEEYKRMRFGLCKDLTCMWEGMNLLDTAPCRADWPWETQFVCAGDQAPQKQSL